MSDWEKDQLHDHFVRMGKDSMTAWKMVRNHAWLLKQRYKLSKRLEGIRRVKQLKEEKEKQEQRSKFLEGLKNA